jgi:hypothetical protein
MPNVLRRKAEQAIENACRVFFGIVWEMIDMQRRRTVKRA